MQAPIYPPAAAYVRPAPQPFEFTIDSITVFEAWNWPPLKAILVAEAPQLTQIMGYAQVQNHISNWTLRDLVGTGLVTAPVLDRIAARVVSLPASERPAP